MITETDKNHILAFMPVMIELEAMGLNPVEVMFSPKSLTIEIIEKCYVAIMRAKEKYPKWSKVMDRWIAKRMRNNG